MKRCLVFMLFEHEKTAQYIFLELDTPKVMRLVIKPPLKATHFSKCFIFYSKIV